MWHIDRVESVQNPVEQAEKTQGDQGRGVDPDRPARVNAHWRSVAAVCRNGFFPPQVSFGIRQGGQEHQVEKRHVEKFGRHGHRNFPADQSLPDFGTVGPPFRFSVQKIFQRERPNRTIFTGKFDGFPEPLPSAFVVFPTRA